MGSAHRGILSSSALYDDAVLGNVSIRCLTFTAAASSEECEHEHETSDPLGDRRDRRLRGRVGGDTSAVVLRLLPRAGSIWISVDGPYNEHLIRDVGSLYLALSAASVAATFSRTADAGRVVGVAWAVFGLPAFRLSRGALRRTCRRSTWSATSSASALSLVLGHRADAARAAPRRRSQSGRASAFRDRRTGRRNRTRRRNQATTRNRTGAQHENRRRRRNRHRSDATSSTSATEREVTTSSCSPAAPESTSSRLEQVDAALAGRGCRYRRRRA